MPNEYEIPIVVFMGFSGLILGFYYIFFIFKDSDNSKIYQIKLISEDLFKFTLIVLMIITYFIPPISFSDVIVDWGDVGVLNYIRAIIFLLGCLYIPGSSLYYFFLEKFNIPNKLNVEPFLVKVTLYPLLSISLIGTSTLIFEKLGLQRDYFTYPLFFIILILYFVDVYFRKRFYISKKFEKTHKINVSRSTMIILFLCLSVIIIGLGFFIVAPYGIREDPHRGIMYAQLVGLRDAPTYGLYCIYWGYISFGLSELSGLPAINVNAMLFPMLFLFISSIFLFNKALMSNKKYVRIVILAVLLFTTFSEFSNFVDTDTEVMNITFLFDETLFMFTFKGAAFYLFNCSITFFVILFKNQEKSYRQSNSILIEPKQIKNKGNHQLLLIVVGCWFLVQSFLLYIFPVIIAFIFVVLYSIYSANKRRNLNFTSYSIIVFLIFFIFFDMISNFFYTKAILGMSSFFFGDLYSLFFSYNNRILFFYSIILVFSAIWFIISNVFVRISSHSNGSIKKKRDRHFLLKIMSILFLEFLILEIIFNLIFKKSNLYFFTYTLHLLYTNLGFLGILVFLFMPLIFKYEKKLFQILVFWFFILVFISTIILVKWVINPLPYYLFAPGFFTIEYWFSRFSFYSIIPLSILGSLLFFNLNKIEKIPKFSKNIKVFSKYILISILIVFLMSNNIQSAIDKSNSRQLNDDEAKVIGWISDNIPFEETILVDSAIYSNYIRDFLFNNKTQIDWEVEWVLNNTDFLDVVNDKDKNCSINLYKNFGNHTNVLAYQDYNQSGLVSTLVRFDQEYQSGWIGFDLMTSNSSKNFYITLSKPLFFQIIAIGLSISSKEIRYFNGTEYQKITNIDEDKWYGFKIFFEASDLNNYNLTKYHWKISINGTDYGAYPFLNNITNLSHIQISTSLNDYNWTTYLANFDFSFDLLTIFEYSIKKYPIILESLRKREIKYFIYTNIDSIIKSKIKEYLDIEYELIPYLYNQTVFHQNDIKIYST